MSKQIGRVENGVQRYLLSNVRVSSIYNESFQKSWWSPKFKLCSSITKISSVFFRSKGPGQTDPHQHTLMKCIKKTQLTFVWETLKGENVERCRLVSSCINMRFNWMDLRFFYCLLLCVCALTNFWREIWTRKKKNEMLLISSFTSITHIILSFERVVHVVIVSRQVAIGN